MLRTLLSEAKKNQPDQLNNDGYSPLGLSILEEKYLASRYLIYANADPNKGGYCIFIILDHGLLDVLI